MKTEVKAENNVANAKGSINRYRQGGGELSKSRPKSEKETIEMYGVCFNYSNGNHANNYSHGTRNVTEYFGRTATYGTDIQSTIMKESPKFIVMTVKVNTGNAEMDNILLVKQLS